MRARGKGWEEVNLSRRCCLLSFALKDDDEFDVHSRHKLYDKL